MELFELKIKVRDKCIPHFMVFDGEEGGVKKAYYHKIAEQMGLKIVVSDCYQDIEKLLINKTLFGGKSLIVLYGDSSFGADTRLMEMFNTKKVSNYFIFVSNNANDLCKKLSITADYRVMFRHLPVSILTKYIVSKIDIKHLYADYMIKWSAFDYGSVMLELDKLLALQRCRPNNTDDEIFLEAYSSDLLHSTEEDIVFKLCNFVITRDVKSFSEYYAYYIENEMSLIPLIAIIYNSYVDILKLLGYKGSQPVKDLSMSYGRYKSLIYSCKNYQVPDIIYYLQSLRKLDNNIKQGIMSESIAIQALWGYLW